MLVSPINPWSSHGKVLTRLLATTLGGIYVVHVQPRLRIIAKRYFKALYGDPARVAPGTFEGYTAGLDPAGSFEHLLKILRSWHDDLTAIHQALGGDRRDSDAAAVGLTRPRRLSVVHSSTAA